LQTLPLPSISDGSFDHKLFQLFSTRLRSLSRDTLFPAWYANHLGTFSNTNDGETWCSLPDSTHRPVSRDVIAVSYNQYSQHKATLYQHIRLHHLELQPINDPKDNNINSQLAHLSYLLSRPFHAFDADTHDHSTLPQNHLLLITHSGILNNSEACPSSAPDTTPINTDDPHRAFVPLSAVVYTSLLVKSGLGKFFESPSHQPLPSPPIRHINGHPAYSSFSTTHAQKISRLVHV
jgi:hypothetical protein